MIVSCCHFFLLWNRDDIIFTAINFLVHLIWVFRIKFVSWWFFDPLDAMVRYFGMKYLIGYFFHFNVQKQFDTCMGNGNNWLARFCKQRRKCFQLGGVRSRMLEVISLRQHFVERRRHLPVPITDTLYINRVNYSLFSVRCFETFQNYNSSGGNH